MIYRITFKIMYCANHAQLENNDPHHETWYCVELFEERRQELYELGIYPHCCLVTTYIDPCHGEYLYTDVSYTVHQNGMLEKSAFNHASGSYVRLPEYFHMTFKDMSV